jgi:glyoxylase-like metal-dependent hydrolase (beta-lactamase superfamily II)
LTLQIHTITIGAFNRYLVGDEGWILIDAGIPYTAGRVERTLAWLGVDPREVRLILLTHGHIDHAGSASALQRLTGASVAIHERDRAWVESGYVAVPRMWGRVGQIAGRPIEWIARAMRFPPVQADVVIGDAGLSLESYGIHGRVIHTPGHTRGSVSLLLESGEAFVGDLGGGAHGPGRKPGIPPAGNDRNQILASWERLFREGVTTIYPGHGPLLPASAMRAALDVRI